jgi:hypothetical protein
MLHVVSISFEFPFNKFHVCTRLNFLFINSCSAKVLVLLH